MVVIDSDFRKKKGHITDVFEIKKEEGLFDVLTEKEIEEAEEILKNSRSDLIGIVINGIPRRRGNYYYYYYYKYYSRYYGKK